ncbi:hypothetical protein [Clostridium perfringens]|uniref:Uncharacterized protein n=1 Tax=Clostridium perfringens TaxID=1502 RepID=A0A140GRA9_CLOPF|nr:hypothetical protein [Clostridium perfringens]AMN31068.1 hypothetical protein JFP838_pA0152 [Clostridium perfringens]
MKEARFEIRKGKDALTQSEMYFGYKDNILITEGYDFKGDLIEDYPEFECAY